MTQKIALYKHGEEGAGNVLGRVSDLAEVVRDFAYRLYTICECKGWTQEALAYNVLVSSWSGIRRGKWHVSRSRRRWCSHEYVGYQMCVSW